MMRKIIVFSLLIFCFSVLPALAQTSKIVNTDLSRAEIDRIVKTFTENEVKFRHALTEYVFNRSATVQTIGMGGQITGVYHRKSFMTFKKSGERFERITYFPMPTIKDIRITQADIEDLGGVNAFALEPAVIPLYNFNFVGKEKIDELNLYVFDIAPKVMPDPKSKARLFSGRIWVDDRDLMIVKSKGKGVPEDKDNKYPVVETWRENIDGKYWFPSLATSDDELLFDSGFAVKLKLRVKYSDYTQGTTDVIILDDDTEVIEDKPKSLPTPSPTPKKP
jgi:hypothetical protein